MHSRITNVIFDLDGTLVDSAPSILACFEAVLAQYKIASKVPLTDKLIGPPLRTTLQLLSNVEDFDQLESMAEEFKKHYDSSAYKLTRTFSGINTMLLDLYAADFSLYIATNKRLKPTRLILEHFGWNRLFKNIFASDSRNPPFSSKSEMLLSLIETEDIVNKETAYVGDRSDDLIAAADNNLIFFAATWGYCDTKSFGAIAVENAAQLGELLTGRSLYEQRIES